MPDARDLTVKLVAEEDTGRLLGGQAVGRGGVDKRVDVVATALYAGLTLEDLISLDLEYAPPFNSVWDPLQAAAATSLLRRGCPADPQTEDFRRRGARIYEGCPIRLIGVSSDCLRPISAIPLQEVGPEHLDCQRSLS